MLNNKILLPAVIILLVVQQYVFAATTRGADGRWYGNICLTQAGAVVVSWQPVGSMCYWQARGLYGFILNE